MTTPRHCPGFEQFKSLKTFTCKCPTAERKKIYFRTSMTKNMCAPDAAKRSILPNVLLKGQEELKGSLRNKAL